jgi:pilus assembly protein CpaF
LPDGSRVNVIAPPLAIDGAALTIRKFKKDKLTLQQLVKYNSISPEGAEVLRILGRVRANVLISGGTGSGKTTLLNILSNFIPPGERIITVEDAAELKLHHEHLISLESRPPNAEGKGAVLIRDLVKNTLRMRPDRIVVGECRGAEALDMLQAMNTGHEGSMATIHANTPRDALTRLENMLSMGAAGLPTKAMRQQISSAVGVVVQVSRLTDGRRKVVSISEITGMEGEMITMQEIFAFRQTGTDEKGMVTGHFCATGVRPKFAERLRNFGVTVPENLFDPTRIFS